ncbi:MAG: hypothetical protein ACK5H2_03530 [Beutenbergiaceae bacterium]
MVIPALAGFLVAALVAGLLLGTGVLRLGGTDSSGGQGPGFETPEEAALAFVAGLREADIDAMAEVFAVESFTENCDNAALLEYTRAYSPIGGYCPYPATSDLGAAANLQARLGDIRSNVVRAVTLHTSPQLWNDGTTETLPDEQAVDDFIQQTTSDFENYPFADLEDAVSVAPRALYAEYDQVAEINESAAAMAGLDPDDYVDVAITFESDGETWLFAPSAGRYDGRWYLLHQHGRLAEAVGMTPMYGGLSRTSELGLT